MENASSATPVDCIVIWYYFAKPVIVLKETATRLFVDPETMPYGLKTIQKSDPHLCHRSKMKGYTGKRIREMEAAAKKTEKRVKMYAERLAFQLDEIERLKLLRDDVSK
jgi:hypothetical protein